MSMRFTLDDESFDLTPELVRARLDGQSPEDIGEYWVEIDGVCWPVKQVIALSTGAKRTRFQSQDSRRLRNLGFPIGTGSAQIAHKPGPTRSPAPRRTFDPSGRWERSRRWTFGSRSPGSEAVPSPLTGKGCRCFRLCPGFQACTALTSGLTRAACARSTSVSLSSLLDGPATTATPSRIDPGSEPAGEFTRRLSPTSRLVAQSSSLSRRRSDGRQMSRSTWVSNRLAASPSSRSARGRGPRPARCRRRGRHGRCERPRGSQDRCLRRIRASVPGGGSGR
jgi:hypothetical protein